MTAFFSQQSSASNGRIYNAFEMVFGQDSNDDAPRHQVTINRDSPTQHPMTVKDALLASKAYLSHHAGDGKNKTICHALLDVSLAALSDPDLSQEDTERVCQSSDLASQLLINLINPAHTLVNWLTGIAKVPADEVDDYDRLQAYRHAWIDHLVAENAWSSSQLAAAAKNLVNQDHRQLR